MKNIKPWIISLVGALFFFYAFIQANMMTPLNGELLRDFGVTASKISLVSASYFYANILFIIPAGLLLDRYSVKILMMIGLFLAVLGSIIFGISDSLYFVALGRFLSGTMMAFGLISCLKLASMWLPSKHMALVSSLIITIGMLGGIAAQIPVAYLVTAFGWRHAVFFIALLGILIGIILFFVVQDKGEKGKSNEGVLDSLKQALRNKINWYCGFFTCFVNLPLAILGALFGTAYLMQARDFSYMQSSIIVSMLFIGMIVGSPFFGWFSDYVQRRKYPMLIGSISCLFFMVISLFVVNISFFMMVILFFILGFTSASQVLGYPVITESNPLKLTGTSLSLAAFIIMGVGYGLFLPFIGKLLDKMWSGKVMANIRFYDAVTYQKAFLVIPFGILIGIIMVFFMKETYCKSINSK